MDAHTVFLRHAHHFMGTEGFWLAGRPRFQCERSLRALHPELLPDGDAAGGGVEALAARYVLLFLHEPPPDWFPPALACHATRYRDSGTRSPRS